MSAYIISYFCFHGACAFFGIIWNFNLVNLFLVDLEVWYLYPLYVMEDI